MRNNIYVGIITNTIIRLSKEFPGIPIGEHIANALQGLDIYNIQDKDLAEMLSRYIADIELDDYYRTKADYPPDE